MPVPRAGRTPAVCCPSIVCCRLVCDVRSQAPTAGRPGNLGSGWAKDGLSLSLWRASCFAVVGTYCLSFGYRLFGCGSQGAASLVMAKGLHCLEAEDAGSLPSISRYEQRVSLARKDCSMLQPLSTFEWQLLRGGGGGREEEGEDEGGDDDEEEEAERSDINSVWPPS